MRNFGSSMLWYWIAYFVVTGIGMLHTVFNIRVLHMRPMDGNSMGEGYERTKPWHPLYNLIVFPLCAWMYLRTLAAPTWEDAALTGAVWVGITIVFDLCGWVLIRHPWRLTPRQFYVDYQPWITLIYLVIAAAPAIAWWLMSL